MKKILVIGAGLSSPCLIRYLVQKAPSEKWHITVADASYAHAAKTVGKDPNATAVELNINDNFQCSELIQRNDLVISMLPASMHVLVAQDCLLHKKHLVTASYISEEMQALHASALKAGVLFLNECGLDPGIDHLSAMEMIHRVQHAGGSVISFKSFCGGLVAPEYDDNPWNYKFTWNPRNVVLAGQSAAKYREHGSLKFIPQSRIFTQTEKITVDDYGEFESYANRDSLNYIVPYGIEPAATVLRGTLRKPGYCASWNQLVRLGLTDDQFIVHNSDQMSYREFVNAFIPGHGQQSVEDRLCRLLGISPSSDSFQRLAWLGLFEEVHIPVANASPARILQALLEEKWKLKRGELDMIVMHHEIEYNHQGHCRKLESSLVVKGEDEVYTAMAKTVGLPLGMAARLILDGKVKARGVQMPLSAELYAPILAELAEHGIRFNEKES
jgi:saccharopine dehydrogenase-like NADP-dependent oxidoreductase